MLYNSGVKIIADTKSILDFLNDIFLKICLLFKEGNLGNNLPILE